MKETAGRLKALVRTLFLIVAISLTASLALAAVVSPDDKQPKTRYVPNQIIVGFKNDTKATFGAQGLRSSAIDSLHSKFQVESIRPLYQQHIRKDIAVSKVRKEAETVYILKFAKDVDAIAAARQYAALPEVRYAEPDYIRTIQRVEPNDLYWSTSNSWGQGYRDQWDMEIINCPAAWEIQTGKASTIIAVLDTGVDYNHPDIAANMWSNPGEIPGNGIDDDGNGFIDDYYGFDFCASSADPLDDNGHGTHCAGTIGAVGNNSIGIAGMNWNCSIMAVKVLDSTGNGPDSNLVAGLVYAADNGAKVINMSLGGAERSQTLSDALAYAHERGCVLVVSAGNGNSDFAADYPAADNRCITVAASDQYDQKCYFSSWGVKTAVAAPGGGPINAGPPCSQYNCLSLRANGTDRLPASCGPGVGIIGDYYCRLAGTSMACPHVAGLAALLISQYPTWTNEQIRQAIQMRADDILEPGFDVYSGFGRINAYASLTSPVPLQALITYPINGDKIWNALTIMGTAAGPGFESYTLDYGFGHNPAVWTNIETNSAPVSNGGLATWDPRGLEPGTYTLRLRTTSTGETLDAEYRLAVTLDSPLGSGHFTERFDIASEFDLAGKSLKFTPDGSSNFYSLCLTDIEQLPTDPSGGMELELDDDDYAEVVLNSEAQISLYGQSRNSFFVGSNGYITLDSGDTSWSENVSDHFALPRISALFDDLSPYEGSVSWKQLSDRVAVTYLSVLEFGGSTGNTFQIEMFFDGRISISYLEMEALDGLVGLSAGSGVPEGFAESDLSRYDRCETTSRVLRVVAPNGGEYYEPGDITQLKWSYSGFDWQAADTVSLFYSDESQIWHPIPNAGALAFDSGSFNWDLTGMAESNHYRVRVVYDMDDSVEDSSDADFTIETDTVPPSISHTPLSDTKNQTGPHHVCATVTDVYGVQGVTLYWSKNGGGFVQTPMAESAYPNQYCASMPGQSVQGDQYCYYIEAHDRSTAQNMSRYPASGSHCFNILDCKPQTPGCPTPEDGAIDVSLDAVLEWSGSSTDPDVVNGGFETGDFTGWAAISAAGNLDPWIVASAEDETWFGTGYPFEGTYYAQNGFDGVAGDYYDLYQEITIPDAASSVALRWSDRLQWDLTHNATSARTYIVTLQQQGGGTPLATLYATNLPPMTTGDTGYVTHTVDLLALSPGIIGKTVRVNFHQTVPESYTGPAQLDLDAVSLILDAVPFTPYSRQGSKLGSADLVDRRTYQQFKAEAVKKIAAATNYKTLPVHRIEPSSQQGASYDVLLGKSPGGMGLIAQGLTRPNFQPAPLERRTKYFWQVISRNECGTTEGPVWSFSTEAAPIIKPADETYVELRQVAVTSTGVDFFYVETTTRESGVRVHKADHGLAIGSVVNVSGVYKTNANCERYVEADDVTTTLATAFLKPLGLTNKSLGGGDWLYDSITGAGQRGIDGAVGLNNIGLLVTVWGKVTARGRDWFYVDDGSRVQDGTGTVGVYCEAPQGVAIPQIGNFVRVTGISSCELYAGRLVNVLMARHAADINDSSSYQPVNSRFGLTTYIFRGRPRDRLK